MSSTSNRVRVGIILATYNQGAYLKDSIASLKKQSFQDFEIIAVDDCSTDESADKLRSVSYDKIIRKIFLKKNVGIGNVVRKYAKLLNNEYLFIFCADDKLHPDYIQKCVKFLDSNPGHAAVATWIQNFGDRSDTMKNITEEVIKLPEMLVMNNFFGSAVVRYKAMDEIGFGNKQKAFQKHNDYDRWVSILENNWELGVIKEPLFYYRRLGSSLSRSINTSDELAFQKVFIKKHDTLFKKHFNFIILELLKNSYDTHNWVKELQGGREWLEEEYHRLTKENVRLHQELDAIKKHPVHRYTAKIKKLPLPKPRKKS